MLPTVAEILALDPLRRGAPRVVAAADGLDAPVRRRGTTSHCR